MLLQVHIDLQPRNSNAFDSMGMFRSNSQMMNMQYNGIPMDPNMAQGFPGDVPNHQGIPQDQQSIPPEADDMCTGEPRGNPNGIPHPMHNQDPRIQDGLHNKNMELENQPKLLQQNGMVNQVMTDQGRFLNDQTFNLAPGFNSSQPPLLNPHLQNGYPQTNEQLIPLNLHRVANNQLVLDPDKDLNNQGVLPNQSLQADGQLLTNQGFNNNGGQLMLPNDQYGSANLLGSNLQQEQQDQPMLGTGGPDMMTGPLTPIQQHHHHHHMHQQQQQPLTPASTHQTEPPHTPTPTPPLQQHGFPSMPMAQNCIEDYLKLFESLQGDPQHHLSGQTDPLQMDPMGNNMNNVYKQDYGRNMGNLMVDMDQNLIPPPLPPNSVPQMVPAYAPNSYIPTSAPAISRPVDQMPTMGSFTPPPPPVCVSSLPSRSSPVASSTFTSTTAEDVRKTILSVLSQERFDEDEELVKSLEDGHNNGGSGSKSNSKESVPLTSLLNIATVTESTGFPMGRMLTENEELNKHAESDSDNEGNLVIVEPDFEEQVVYEACNIASSSNVQTDLENQTMNEQTDPTTKWSTMNEQNDPTTKWSTVESGESPPLQNRVNFSEYEDDYRNCSNTGIQMENNFAKPLKKRLRLKLKVNGENDESEVNTPIESDTLVLPELTNQEQEPVSRKKHLLDSSKNMEIEATLTTPTEPNLQMFEQVNRTTTSPIKDINSAVPNDDIEDVYQIQSKKQKASSKQQENKEKEAKSKEAPMTMKPPHRKLKCKDESSNSSVPSFKEDTTDSLETLETMKDERSKFNVEEPPSLEVVASVHESTERPRGESPPRSPPKLVISQVFHSTSHVFHSTKPGKKHIKQSSKDNVKPAEKKKDSLKVAKIAEFNCELCGRVFPKAERLEYHLSQHKKNELFPCKQCGQEFGRLGELTRHERQQHTETVYKCRACSAEFNNCNLYKTHCLKVHNEKHPFYCTFPECTYNTEKLSRLEQHKLTHSESKSHRCENCGQSFRQLNGLRSHESSCKKQERYKCKVCDKKFNYKHILKQHELMHSGVRPYECQVCFIRVRDPKNLKRHMRIHEDTYPYQCPHCPKKYRFSNTLKKHLLHHGHSRTKDIDSVNSSSIKPKSNFQKTLKNPKKMRRSKSTDAMVVICDQDDEHEPRLWDATAVTVKSVDAGGEEILKVKLEASLVTDSGYV